MLSIHIVSKYLNLRSKVWEENLKSVVIIWDNIGLCVDDRDVIPMKNATGVLCDIVRAVYE